jgi:hypothetical protein
MPSNQRKKGGYQIAHIQATGLSEQRQKKGGWTDSQIVGETQPHNRVHYMDTARVVASTTRKKNSPCEIEAVTTVKRTAGKTKKSESGWVLYGVRSSLGQPYREREAGREWRGEGGEGRSQR